jgi:Holliday junction resolvasome RuvABC endonuclease subunit
MRTQGAVAAAIPERILTWESDPITWRRELGLNGNASKEECAAAVIDCGDTLPLDWPQDAYDAWAVAYWAREENRRRLERRIA